MDIAKNTPSVLSLCSGYGGIEIGLERVFGEITVLAHVEIEAFAITNLVNKMETGRMAPVPIWTDLKSFRSEIFRGHVDILTGGYPCQPFSTAGKRLGEDDPRHLWPDIKRTIRDCRPKLCFFENVEGHISLGLREVLRDLEELGYRVENSRGEPTWGIFSATEVGAPHQRKRVFILANGLGEYGGAQAERWIDDWQTRYPGEELAYCVNDRNEARVSRQGQGEEGHPGELNDESPQRWPSHPGEEQYEWEEPRVVVVTKSPERWGAGNQSHVGRGLTEAGRPDRTDGPNRQTQPELGRATSGLRARVDRLRLLGNGVVPQTAEKAFITLMRRILYGRH